MADTKLTGLSAVTNSSADEPTYLVDDPGGTPVSQKITLLDLLFAAGDVSVTGATTATIGRMHVCSGTTADYTVTLPAASGNAGKLIGFRISPALTSLITLDGNSSETIDGALTRIMWAEEAAILSCDGSNWFKIGGKTRAMSAEMYASASADVPSRIHTKVGLDTIVSNLGGMADTANRRFNIKRPSVYLLTPIIRFCAASPNHGAQFSVACTRVISGIYLNGALLAPYAEVDTPGATFPTPQFTLRQTLATGDTVESYAIQVSGTTQGFQGYTASAQYSSMVVVEVPQW